MYVGVDPSLSATGVVILNEEAKLVDSTLIKTDPTQTWRGRVCRINFIKEQVKDFLYKNCEGVVDLGVTPVVLEDYSYGSRFQSHQLGELGFALRWFLYLAVLDQFTYVVPPTVIKKFITGLGNSAKPFVALQIAAQFDLKFNDLNLSDACACALFGLANTNRDLFSKEQLGVLDDYNGRT